MKKRILKIAAFVAAVVMIVGICLFAISLVGNPISKALARNTAEKHIDTAYGDKDLVLERVSYSFKDGYYHAYITSPSDIDGSFTLMIDSLGKLRADTYEDRVLGGWNIADRIRRDYRSRVDAVLEHPAFPYDVPIGYGDIEFISQDYQDASVVPSYAIVTEELTAGGFFDPNELGARAGKLTIYIDDSTVSVERMSEILLDIRRIFDESGIKFHVIDCVLEHPQAEEALGQDERVEVMDFLYCDIEPEGLVERVRASDEAARTYYDEQDAIK